MRYIFVILAFSFFGNIYAQPSVGESAPDFTIVDVHGETHNLYSYLDDGKFVVIDLFGTTCVPCELLVPTFNDMYRNYGCNQSDLIFLAINYSNTDGDVLAFEEQQGGIYPAASGVNGGGYTFFMNWEIGYWPQLILINPDRTIASNISPITQNNIDSVFSIYNIPQDTCISDDILDYSPPQNNINIYPNPCKDKVRIEMSEYLISDVEVSFIDITGNIILTKTISQKSDIDVSMLSKGMYIVQIISEKYTSKQKVLIE